MVDTGEKWIFVLFEMKTKGIELVPLNTSLFLLSLREMVK
jgi:hypothetical protein